MNTQFWLALFVAIPVGTFAFELVVGARMWMKYHQVRGRPGSALLKAIVTFVWITALAQSLNVALALYILWVPRESRSAEVALGLFFGAQIFRAIAISVASWFLLRLQRVHS